MTWLRDNFTVGHAGALCVYAQYQLTISWINRRFFSNKNDVLSETNT